MTKGKMVHVPAWGFVLSMHRLLDERSQQDSLVQRFFKDQPLTHVYKERKKAKLGNNLTMEMVRRNKQLIKMPTKKNALCEDTLKVSFFRLDPEDKYESRLRGALHTRIAPAPLAMYKALGHYDIIALYPVSCEEKMLHGGTIEGIRSFSTLDCFCWKPHSPARIIQTINSHRLLCVVAFSLDPESIGSAKGIPNLNFTNRTDAKNVYSINSPSFSEQFFQSLTIVYHLFGGD